MENAELSWSDYFVHADRKTGVVDNKIEVQYWFYSDHSVINGSRYFLKFVKLV